MKIDIITIFPEYFGPLRMSLLGRAAERGIVGLAVHDLRNWAHDVHRTVDDAPFGGGPGMVMTPGPWGEALDAVLGGDGGPAQLIVPSPSGELFGQPLAAAYARSPHLVFACGRYEGIDARVVQDARDRGKRPAAVRPPGLGEQPGTGAQLSASEQPEADGHTLDRRVAVDEVSVGDYVLSGGEPAALVMIDAIIRLLPGVLGNAASVADDSFGGGDGPMAGLLEGPVYTRPREWRGREVPPILLSGDHGAIARWRRDEALRRTAASRPDLLARLAAAGLDAQDRAVLSEAGFPVSGEDMAH